MLDFSLYFSRHVCVRACVCVCVCVCVIVARFKINEWITAERKLQSREAVGHSAWWLCCDWQSQLWMSCVIWSQLFGSFPGAWPLRHAAFARARAASVSFLAFILLSSQDLTMRPRVTTAHISMLKLLPHFNLIWSPNSDSRSFEFAAIKAAWFILFNTRRIVRHINALKV